MSSSVRRYRELIDEDSTDVRGPGLVGSETRLNRDRIVQWVNGLNAIETIGDEYGSNHQRRETASGGKIS